MSRKLFIALIVSNLFLGQFSAVAAVKAGSSCSKLGITSTHAGKKYTCIKSGKKLVWNKGVAIAKPVPAVTPTPTPTPTPTVSPTVKPLVEGDSCVTIGETVSNSTGYLECRARDGNRQQYFQLSKSFVPLQIPNTSDPLTTCQLRDQRPVTSAYFWQEYRAVAYPAKPERGFVNSGEQKIVIVGIDFVDAPGVGSPKSILEETIKISSEWIKWYSQNKLSWNFVTYDKWIRAPKESQELKTAEVGEDAQITDKIKHEYIGEIDKYLDLKDAAAIWIIYPDTISKIYAESQNRSYYNPVSIKNGAISPLMLAIGKETYLASRLPWLFFTHETMHGQGLMGHSPHWPYIFGIMYNEYSPSHNLNGWESLIMGWGSTQNLYCKDIKNLSSFTLTLAPIEREQLGISTVLIKLSETKVLAIESHRVDKWSPLQIPGLYGVSTYVIDLAVDNRAYLLEPPGRYLKLNNVSHGFSPIRGKPIPGFENFGTNLIDGVGVAGGSGTDLNVMMYLGESLVYEGVKISLINSGDNDTIRIEKTP
jgi:hypothetical protein